MEPSIQYARTSDGTGIAFWKLGEGPVIVAMPPLPLSNLRAEWQVPEWSAWYRSLAERHTVVRYDGRGSGLSDRDAPDFSIGAQLRDLHAVTSRLSLDRFTLFASFYAGPVAITYAAAHPKKVENLVLWHTFLTAGEFVAAPDSVALLGLLEHDWDLFTETLAHARLGWDEGEDARRLAAYFRQCIDPGALRMAFETLRAYDVTDDARTLNTRTLVMHREGFRIPIDVSRRVALAIPGARLALVSGGSAAPYDHEALAVISDFLGDPPLPSRGAELSAREMEVLRLIADGMSNKEIAGTLMVSLATVKTHINNIYAKLGANRRTQALSLARAARLIK